VEDTPNPAKVDNSTQGQFGIQNVYVKDISFETPNSPHIFLEQTQPKTELEMSTSSNKLNEETYEVVLNITVTVKVGEKTAYLVEVHQAGIFAIKDFSNDKLSYMIHSYCPTILFPFARETISNLVSRGGFQPLWLSPLNFEAIYAQQLQKQSEKEAVAEE